jgi:hypothetical protein
VPAAGELEPVLGGTPVRWSNHAAHWCASTRMLVYATGNGRFIETLIRGLEIR